MLRTDSTVILKNGEVITAAEMFEALLRFADQDSPFPIMGRTDKAKAVIAVAFEALDFNEDKGII